MLICIFQEFSEKAIYIFLNITKITTILNLTDHLEYQLKSLNRDWKFGFWQFKSLFEFSRSNFSGFLSLHDIYFSLFSRKFFLFHKQKISFYKTFFSSSFMFLIFLTFWLNRYKFRRRFLWIMNGWNIFLPNLNFWKYHMQYNKYKNSLWVF